MTQLRAAAAADGKRLYQSEYGNNSSTGLSGGIGLANRITNDVNVMGVHGWAYWQVVEPLSLSGAGWGLAWAGYGQADSDYYLRKQYHVMRQFSSHIRPGSHILDTSDADTVAAYDPVTETTVLVVTNDTNSPVNKSYTLLDGAPMFTRVIRTTDSDNYASLGNASLNGAQLTVDLPGPSVTTLRAPRPSQLDPEPSLRILGRASRGNSSGGWLAGDWRRGVLRHHRQHGRWRRRGGPLDGQRP